MEIRPYVTFDGECIEAIDIYKRAFRAEETQTLRFRDLPSNAAWQIPEDYLDRVMQVTLKFGNHLSVCPTAGRNKS